MTRLYRSTTNRWLAGVFGGLGEILGIDPNIVRLVAVFFGVATFLLPLVVTYLVAWLVLPEGPPAPS